MTYDILILQSVWMFDNEAQSDGSFACRCMYAGCQSPYHSGRGDGTQGWKVSMHVYVCVRICAYIVCMHLCMYVCIHACICRCYYSMLNAQVVSRLTYMQLNLLRHTCDIFCPESSGRYCADQSWRSGLV